MNAIDNFRGCDNITVLHWILDDKRHNRCNEQTFRAIYWVFSQLIAHAENNVLELILSNDSESRSIGIQLLISFWLDWYIEVFNDVKWRSILTTAIINIAEVQLLYNKRWKSMKEVQYSIADTKSR